MELAPFAPDDPALHTLSPLTCTIVRYEIGRSTADRNFDRSAAGIFAFAAPVWQQRPTGYVNDFAHVLDANTVAQIENIAQQVDQKGKAQIAVVTIPSLEGSDIESYAVQLYKTWGIGYKGTDHGVLILLAVQDRRYRTEVGYGLEPILPDGKVGGFWREAVPNLKAADYSGAILLVTTRIADVIAKDAGFEISTDRTNLAPIAQEPQGIPAGAIIFLIIVVLIVLATPFGRALLWGMLLGGGMGRRGGYGGGSYGRRLGWWRFWRGWRRFWWFRWRILGWRWRERKLVEERKQR